MIVYCINIFHIHVSQRVAEYDSHLNLYFDLAEEIINLCLSKAYIFAINEVYNCISVKQLHNVRFSHNNEENHVET